MRFFENLITKYNTAVYLAKMCPNLRIFGNLIKGYLKVNLFRRNQIRLVEIFVTLTCNAKCDFCSNGLFAEGGRYE